MKYSSNFHLWTGADHYKSAICAIRQMTDSAYFFSFYNLGGAPGNNVPETATTTTPTTTVTTAATTLSIKAV